MTQTATAPTVHRIPIRIRAHDVCVEGAGSDEELSRYMRTLDAELHQCRYVGEFDTRVHQGVLTGYADIEAECERDAERKFDWVIALVDERGW